MTPLRRLTRWWHTHRPISQARHQAIIAEHELTHAEDKERIAQLVIERENLQAQLATLRSLLAANERELTRQRQAHDEATDEINRLAAEVRRLRRHARLLDRGLIDQMITIHISPN